MRDDFIDKHHMTPQSRLRAGAKPLKRNRLRIKRYRHKAWHLLFGNRTLDEIIALLIRVRRFKSH